MQFHPELTLEKVREIVRNPHWVHTLLTKEINPFKPDYLHLLNMRFTLKQQIILLFGFGANNKEVRELTGATPYYIASVKSRYWSQSCKNKNS